jgi:hypothetical protein
MIVRTGTIAQEEAMWKTLCRQSAVNGLNIMVTGQPSVGTQACTLFSDLSAAGAAPPLPLL